MCNRKGFTLSEVIISIAIMGLLIITVLGVFSAGVNAIKKGRYQATAISLLESKISQVKLLFIKYPQADLDIEANLPLSISGNITSTGPVILWPSPAGPVNIKIEGYEDLGEMGSFAFTISITDFEGLLYNYEMRKVTVTISRITPPIALTMSTLIGMGIH